MRERSLSRRMDRVEDAAAWLLTVVGMVVLVVAGVLGVGAYSQGMQQVLSDQADRLQVVAVLLADAPTRVNEHGAAAPFVQVPARWTDGAGVSHEGEVSARSNSRAGAEVRVWVDHRGELARPPAGRASALAAASAVAVMVLALGGTLIAASWLGLRRVMFAYNTRAWEREWARVGPDWSSQQPK